MHYYFFVRMWLATVRNKFCLLSYQASILTFSYSSKINGYLNPQRDFLPLKKIRGMSSEGNAAHPIGCDSPHQIVMTILAHFLFFNLLNFLSRV
jgi:hypothetical protein